MGMRTMVLPYSLLVVVQQINSSMVDPLPVALPPINFPLGDLRHVNPNWPQSTNSEYTNY